MTHSSRHITVLSDTGSGDDDEVVVVVKRRSSRLGGTAEASAQSTAAAVSKEPAPRQRIAGPGPAKAFIGHGQNDSDRADRADSPDPLTARASNGSDNKQHRPGPSPMAERLTRETTPEIPHLKGAKDAALKARYSPVVSSAFFGSSSASAASAPTTPTAALPTLVMPPTLSAKRRYESEPSSPTANAISDSLHPQVDSPSKRLCTTPSSRISKRVHASTPTLPRDLLPPVVSRASAAGGHSPSSRHPCTPVRKHELRPRLSTGKAAQSLGLASKPVSAAVALDAINVNKPHTVGVVSPVPGTTGYPSTDVSLLEPPRSFADCLRKAGTADDTDAKRSEAQPEPGCEQSVLQSVRRSSRLDSSVSQQANAGKSMPKVAPSPKHQPKASHITAPSPEQLARNAIMERFSTRVAENFSFAGQDDRQTASMVHDLLERTVKLGESNSMLIVGGRGTGKTTVLNAALRRLAAVEESAGVGSAKPFYEVYLSGLVHTDDRLALRSIAKQLHMEANVTSRQPGSFAETLAYILATLKAGTHNSTPIIFILDEMDLFAQHAKQTLLYNLFDISQKNENPVAVIGLTCRLDAIELLEKRVKSRFSHRVLHLYPAKSFEEFCATLESMMTLNAQDMRATGHGYSLRFNHMSRCEPLPCICQRREQHGLSAWLLKDAKTDIDHTCMPLGHLCCIGNCIPAQEAAPGVKHVDPGVQRMHLHSLCLTPEHSYPRPEILQESIESVMSDNKVAMIQGFSVLELCLLVAVQCLLQRQVTAFNFEMVFDEYREFAQRVSQSGRMGAVVGTPKSGSRSASGSSLSNAGGSIFFVKRVALKAFETLVELGMVRACDGGGSITASSISSLMPSLRSGPKEYRMVQSLVSRAQIRQAIKEYSGPCPDALVKWSLSG
ncbi:origin recognition complex subunit 4 C-terminus-domain-containing protein [Entophlyctis helioformis]|nr:origin recognition complex subunit 4 C-terminus-domain-containing protein [Entophlyctis helioformis]